MQKMRAALAQEAALPGGFYNLPVAHERGILPWHPSVAKPELPA